MTTMNLDDQIVASAYNKATRECSFTYEHTDGSRYTVTFPIDELHKIGITPMTLDQRRKHLATKIINHIQTNPPDHVRRPT